MSLLMGIGKGLEGAGQAIGAGLAQYARMLQAEDFERMRQTSMEKRWAIEDARYARREARDEQRYKDTVERQERMDARADSRELRAESRQTVTMLSKSLDRLDSMKADKERQIREMFTDPMTKQITDAAGYQAAMSALNTSYLSDAKNMVTRSGLTESEANQYGFGMYLDGSEQPALSQATVSPPTPEPTPAPQPFNVSGWASKVREKNQPSVLFGNGAYGDDAGTMLQRSEQMTNRVRGPLNQHYSKTEAMSLPEQPDYSTPLIGSGLLQQLNK